LGRCHVITSVNDAGTLSVQLPGYDREKVRGQRRVGTGAACRPAADFRGREPPQPKKVRWREGGGGRLKALMKRLLCEFTKRAIGGRAQSEGGDDRRRVGILLWCCQQAGREEDTKIWGN